MKELTELVQQFVYIAEDGKKSRDRDECIEYESNLVDPIMSAVNAIKHCIAPLEYVELSASDTDCLVCFCPETAEELEALRSWCDKYGIKSELDVPDACLLHRILIFDCSSDRGYVEDLKDIGWIHSFYGTPEQYKVQLKERVDRMLVNCWHES